MKYLNILRNMKILRVLAVYFIGERSYFENEGFDSLCIGGDKVDILWLIPITDNELQYKLKYGGQAFEELIAQAEMSPIVDENRKSLI